MPFIDQKDGYRFSTNSQDLITPEGKKWLFVKKLEGRGQSAFAAFYRDEDNHQTYLVKCDAPGVCLAEATATRGFLPEAYKTSINCADIGVLNGQTMTIQPLVENATPLDKIVYNKKRNPRAVISYELRYKQQIKDFLESLTLEAKMDLAHSLYASTALGDESLHLGQFLALMDTKDQTKVNHIVRIDFGARERYALARSEQSDFSPIKTSKHYKKSGQFGKDYISFLLADSCLKQQFLILWAQSNVEKIVATQIETFKDKLSKLPEEQSNLALEQLLQDMNKKANLPYILPKNRPYLEKVHLFLDMYKSIIRDRCISMKQHARQELSKLLELPLLRDNDKVLYNFLTKITNVDPDQIEKLLTEIRNATHSENISYSEKERYHLLLETIETRLLLQKNQQHNDSSTAEMLQQFGRKSSLTIDIPDEIEQKISITSAAETGSLTTSEELSSEDESEYVSRFSC